MNPVNRIAHLLPGTAKAASEPAGAKDYGPVPLTLAKATSLLLRWRLTKQTLEGLEQEQLEIEGELFDDPPTDDPRPALSILMRDELPKNEERWLRRMLLALGFGE